MSLNIDDIEIKSKFSLFWEIKDFIIIFTIIFWFWWLFINAQLVVILFNNIFDNTVSARNIVLASPNEKFIIKHIKKHITKHTINNNVSSDNMTNLKNKILWDD